MRRRPLVCLLAFAGSVLAGAGFNVLSNGWPAGGLQERSADPSRDLSSSDQASSSDSATGSDQRTGSPAGVEAEESAEQARVRIEKEFRKIFGKDGETDYDAITPWARSAGALDPEFAWTLSEEMYEDCRNAAREGIVIAWAATHPEACLAFLDRFDPIEIQTLNRLAASVWLLADPATWMASAGDRPVDFLRFEIEDTLELLPADWLDKAAKSAGSFDALLERLSGPVPSDAIYLEDLFDALVASAGPEAILAKRGGKQVSEDAVLRAIARGRPQALIEEFGKQRGWHVKSLASALTWEQSGLAVSTFLDPETDQSIAIGLAYGLSHGMFPEGKRPAAFERLQDIYLSNLHSKDRQSISGALGKWVEAWAGVDASAALHATLGVPDIPEESRVSVGHSAGRSVPLETLSDERVISDAVLFKAVVSGWCQEDLLAASEYASTLPDGGTRISAASAIAAAVMPADPQAGFRWISSIPASQRSAAIHDAVAACVARDWDPGLLLTELPVDSPLRPLLQSELDLLKK